MYTDFPKVRDYQTNKNQNICWTWRQGRKEKSRKLNSNWKGMLDMFEKGCRPMLTYGQKRKFLRRMR